MSTVEDWGNQQKNPNFRSGQIGPPSISSDIFRYMSEKRRKRIKFQHFFCTHWIPLGIWRPQQILRLSFRLLGYIRRPKYTKNKDLRNTEGDWDWIEDLKWYLFTLPKPPIGSYCFLLNFKVKCCGNTRESWNLKSLKVSGQRNALWKCIPKYIRWIPGTF